jgi:hypothetical protein
MTTPTFTTPPAVTPIRGSATFSADASAWVTWQSGFEPELSVAMPWVAARVADVAADLVLTNADVVLTNADVVSTNADVVTTGNDVTAAAAQVALATTQANNSEASSATASTYADNSEGSKDSAAISATSASDTAAGLTGFDLGAIAETKAITAVAGTVYKTALDSDGGAWINGAASRATEWYNEALNTATRGGTRAFPAVAVPIAQASSVTIYDGDDPDLPMWNVEDYTGLTITSVAMINGKLIIGTTTGVIVSDYASGKLGTTTPDYTTSTTPAIAGSDINDVVITYLPTAPINAATGLQEVTIALGVEGGATYMASVIQNDGNVYDVAAGSIARQIAISSNYELILVRSDGTVYVWDDISAIAADGTAPDTTYAAADNFGTPTIVEAA